MCHHLGIYIPEKHLAEKPSVHTGCSPGHYRSAVRPIKSSFGQLAIHEDMEITLIGEVEKIFEKKIFKLPISCNNNNN